MRETTSGNAALLRPKLAAEHDLEKTKIGIT